MPWSVASLGVGYVLALGSLLAASRGIRQSPAEITPGVVMREISLRAALGMLLHLTLALTVRSLRHAILLGGVLAALGAVRAAWEVRGGGRGALTDPRETALRVVALIGLTTLVTSALLVAPLIEWDARSVWFFHGRMIYFADGLRSDAGWQEPSLRGGLFFYPKLVPVLGASVATIHGHWNEYLPKLGLVPLFVATVGGLFGSPTRFKALALPIVGVLGAGRLIYNGYADGYLALAATGALCAWMRYLRDEDPRDFAHGAVLLALAMSLKAEGKLFAVGLATALALSLARSRSLVPLPALLRERSALALSSIGFVPVIIWSVRAGAWGLSNYLTLDASAVARAAERVRDGSWRAIGPALWSPRDNFGALSASLPTGAALALVAILVAYLRTRERPDGVATLPLLVLVAYVLMLAAVYLLSPYDLRWQLGTSAGRTMLIPAFLLAVVTLEAASRAASPGTVR